MSETLFLKKSFSFFYNIETYLIFLLLKNIFIIIKQI